MHINLNIAVSFLSISSFYHFNKLIKNKYKKINEVKDSKMFTPKSLTYFV